MAHSTNTPGFQALQRGAAVLDLASRGRIRVTGEDRARLLHAMTTNHVSQLRPGEGLYAFFLNAQGRIQADVYLLCFEDHLLLDLEPPSRTGIYEHLDRYIIADDATLEDVTESTFCFGLEGPEAAMVALSVGMPAPDTPFGHSAWKGCEVAAISATGAPGFRIYGPLEARPEVEAALTAGEAVPAGAADAEAVRIANFKPRFGQDITDNTLPQETQQMQALHFQKGCYLGQEIVERIRSRGHVNKQLMGFRVEGHAAEGHAAEGADAIRPGAKLIAGGKEAGEVTSVITGPDGAVSGLAYVRLPYNKPGGTVGIEGRPATLFAPWGGTS